ncbi:MAG: hypothetical protein CMJ83_13835 [Planctomycetes bacterium]|nr:hypothetical protein [Planctomycetota bacterium]
MAPCLDLQIEPALVEESVFRELVHWEESGRVAQPRRYHAVCAHVLHTAPPGAERDRRLLEVNERWFEQLGLRDQLVERVRELPPISGQVQAVFAQRARSAREEGADLVGAPGGERLPTLVIRVRPESFGRTDELRTTLRRDLAYVADMLDPTFDYAPELPADLVGPVRGLVQDRYGTLWALSIAARLHRRFGEGGLPDPAALLRRVFPAADPVAARELLGAVTGPVRPTHVDLLRFARAAVPAAAEALL